MAKQNREADLLQGTLDLLVLQELAREPLHGYAIVQRIQERSGESLNIRQGSLYPALYRMEEQGWLRSAWKEGAGGRPAKVYTITAAGKKQLESELAGWRKLVAAIGLVIAPPKEA